MRYWYPPKSYEEALSEARAAIDTAQKANLLGHDIRDHLYSDINTAYIGFLCSVERKKEFQKYGFDDPVGPFLLRALKRTRNYFPILGRRHRAISILNKEIRENQHKLKKSLERLMTASVRRASCNPKGCFYTLAEMQVLVSPFSNQQFPIRGRYEDVGKELLQLVKRLIDIQENILPKLLKSKSSEKYTARIDGLLLAEALAHAIDAIIQYMVAVPFDIEQHEEAVQKGYAAITVLERLIEVFQTPPELMQWVDDLDALDKELLAKKEAYNEKSWDFAQNLNPREIPPEQRSFPHIGIKEGKLSDTDFIIHRMTTSRDSEIPGLGLPLVCTGCKSRKTVFHSGGGGKVYQMMLSKDELDESCSQLGGKLLAVKVPKIENSSSEAIALANLRMVREADQWAIASSDPRASQNNGYYLAQILGVWSDFSEGRPGLVSLWTDESHLALYISEHKPGVQDRLLLASKIARGVQFLHTCHPPIIHGDLKTGNILVIEGEPRITDFGIAKRLDDVKGYTTGHVPYTDDYRAPELEYRLESLVSYPTKASDVYAFGCVLFETMTGKGLFEKYHKAEKWDRNATKLDITPIEAEMELPEAERKPIPDEQVQLMNSCFKFHASKRIMMDGVVASLNLLVGEGSGST